MSEEEKKAVEWFKEDLTKEKEEMRYYNEYKKQVIKRNEKLLNLIYNQQEEIDTWKETENDYEHEIARKDEEIEKQQKEIEEKDKYIKAIVDIRIQDSKENYSDVIDKYFINKDKIRDILKDLDEFDTTFFNANSLKEAIKNSLNRLLEEN